MRQDPAQPLPKQVLEHLRARISESGLRPVIAAVRLKILIALLVVPAALLLSACSGQGAKATTATTTVETNSDPNLLSIDHPEQFPLVSVETRKIADILRVNGVVSPDISRAVPVLSLSGGRVVETRVRLGDDVKKGQVLLLISSPDIAAAFSDYQKYSADELLARKQLERSQLLFSRGAIAQRDLEAAQNAENKALVDQTTAANRLRILGADPDHPSPILSVKAPISGTIIEQNTTNGGAVRSIDNSPSLFTIADMSRVWVLCDVYENMLDRVHLGDTAEIRLNAYPDRAFTGRVGNISRVLDPSTRTAKVRIEMENPQGFMRAAMFVTASFRSRKEAEQVVIPASAILRLHDKDWVFKPVGGNKFRRTEIQTGLSLPDNTQEVLAGLQPGDKVVSNALQFSSASETQ